MVEGSEKGAQSGRYRAHKYEGSHWGLGQICRGFAGCPMEMDRGRRAGVPLGSQPHI